MPRCTSRRRRELFAGVRSVFPNWQRVCYWAQRRCVLTSTGMIQLAAAGDVNTISSMGCRRCAAPLRVDPADGGDSPREKMVRLDVTGSGSAL